MKIEIKLPFKTPTINHLYGQRGFRKFLTKIATELREKIYAIVYDFMKERDLSELMSTPLKVVIEVHEDWYTKKQIVRRIDIANREKFLVDSVFNALGIDDKFIFEHTMRKIQDTEEFSIIEIEAIAS